MMASVVGETAIIPLQLVARPRWGAGVVVQKQDADRGCGAGAVNSGLAMNQHRLVASLENIDQEPQFIRRWRKGRVDGHVIELDVETLGDLTFPPVPLLIRVAAAKIDDGTETEAEDMLIQAQ